MWVPRQGRELACLILALMLLPVSVTADVSISPPVQLLAKGSEGGTLDTEGQNEQAENSSDDNSKVSSTEQTEVISDNSSSTIEHKNRYPNSSGTTWSDAWEDSKASFYKVKMWDATGRIVDHATIEPVITYDETDWRIQQRDFYWHVTDLVTGVYRYERTGIDAAGHATVIGEDTIYFIDNVSLLLAPGERLASATYSKYGVHIFKWYPLLNLEQMKITSSRYRIRITNDDADAKEDFAASIIVDAYTTSPDYEIAKKNLPVGSYTVKVWCYQRGSGAADPYILHLTIRNPWAKYDYNLKDLNITPGEAITRQHAAGSKDMTLYGTVALTTEETPGTQLRLGGETLEVSCGGTPVAASVAGDTLTLRADGTDWRISLKALHTLRDSGINTLRLSLQDGSIRQLETDLEPSGRQYGLLRAAGLVSKDFTLCPDPEGDGWTVEADGRAFDLAGTELIPRTAKEAGE